MPNTNMDYAKALFSVGELDAAAKMCRSILKGAKRNFEANYLLATIEVRRGNCQAAEPLLAQACRLAPKMPEVWALHGNVLIALSRPDEALVSFDRAISANPNFLEVHYNRGKLLKELGRLTDAIDSYDRALAINPNFADALANRGNLLAALKRFEEAAETFGRLFRLKHNFEFELGNLLAALKRFEEAAETFGRLFRLEPNFEFALGNYIHCKQQSCSWTGLTELLVELGQRIRDGQPVASPWVTVSASPDPSLQRRCAEIMVSHAFRPARSPIWRGERYSHERIRVAYVSADFREHATAYLAAGLFESHDRARFEISGISFGPDRNDAMRERLKHAFDHFLDVRTSTDLEVASLIREMEIDILVDLKGFTAGCRTGIFALRAAPIQINYLGYPGTMGAPYMDYLLADRHIIPEEYQSHYTESVVYLPDTYQVNDAKRITPSDAPSRVDVGLPGEGFVFCCFNGTYKITPEVFAIWMRLLKQLPNSVLWLLSDSPSVIHNLRLQTSMSGVDPERLVFAPPLPLREHLVRLQLADLFLDTLPCSAHTTASDALWVGLPILTCLGSTFAGRVAASLLNSLGLQELVTRSWPEYEVLALSLARRPQLLVSIREKLHKKRTTSPVFDTDRFRRHIESAYITMWERHQHSEDATGFSVAPIAG